MDDRRFTDFLFENTELMTTFRRNILYGKLYTKNLQQRGPIFSRDTRLPNSKKNPTVNYVFLRYYVYTKNYNEIKIFKHQNQLRPMSFLSHTHGAHSDHSWLVFEILATKLAFQK